MRIIFSLSSIFQKNGFTPLHIAAKKNQVNITTLLLDHGVEADMTTKHGVSPLHLAAKEGHVETVAQLLEHGASPAIHTTVSARLKLFVFKEVISRGVSDK